MKISNILIEDKIKEKILYKHNISSYEVKWTLLDKPLILKIENGRCLGLGFYRKYITIIFEMKNSPA